MKIKNSLLQFWGLLIVVMIVTSCEDVIEVDVPGSNEGIIVDAWLTDLDTTQQIRVSNAIPYFDNQLSPGITNAEVTVTRGDGEVFEFSHAGDGLYTWEPEEQMIGGVGDTYQIQVSFDGNTISGSAEMNRVPIIDVIEFEFRDDQLGGDDGLYAQFLARDFPGKGDAYWIKTYRDGVYQGDAGQLNIAYDAGFDSGTGIDGIVFITPIREALNFNEDGTGSEPHPEGQTLRVEIHSISIEAFNFLEIARDQITNGNNGIFALPLANTPTNLSSSDGTEVIGFFNVAAVSTAEATAQ